MVDCRVLVMADCIGHGLVIVDDVVGELVVSVSVIMYW